MIAIQGTVRNGHIVLDAPTGLSEGTRVRVLPVEARPDNDDLPMTPEEIASLLKRMEEIEPLEMTAAEEADLADARKMQREHDLANWDRRSRRIEEMFE